MYLLSWKCEEIHQIPWFNIQLASTLVNMSLSSYPARTKSPIWKSFTISKQMFEHLVLRKQKVNTLQKGAPHGISFCLVALLALWWAVSFPHWKGVPRGLKQLHGETGLSHKQWCSQWLFRAVTSSGFGAECRWAKSRVYEFDLVNRIQDILVWIKQLKEGKLSPVGTARELLASPQGRGWCNGGKPSQQPSYRE